MAKHEVWERRTTGTLQIQTPPPECGFVSGALLFVEIRVTGNTLVIAQPVRWTQYDFTREKFAVSSSYWCWVEDADVDPSRVNDFPGFSVLADDGAEVELRLTQVVLDKEKPPHPPGVKGISCSVARFV